MRFRASTLGLAFVLIGVSPPCAGAAQPGRPLSLVARDVQVVTSDGRRYVAFQQQRNITVLDTKTERRYVAASSGCSLPATPSPVSHLVAFPKVLVSCAAEVAAVRLLDVRSGGMIALPRGPGWNRIGRYWVEQDQLSFCPGASGMCEAFYQWHTGATRYLPESQLYLPLADAAQPLAAPRLLDRNLDSAGLTQTVPCSPYQAQSVENGFDTYEPPHVLIGFSPFAPPPRVPAGIALGRCGSSARLSLTHGPATGAELSAGNASWAETTRAYDYDIATKRTYSWAPPGASVKFATPVAALHTRYDVLVARTTRETCFKLCDTADVALYRAPLPG
jgi:hypothetical protein